MGSYLITVIIPVYNTDKWLGSCLDSVIGQDMKEIEIICVNDGSTDNSTDILLQYAQKDNRIRILTHERNQGAVAARKTGVMAAAGDYIMFVDSDDTIDPELCSTVYSEALKHNTDILEFSAHRFNTENQTELLVEPPDVLLRGEEIISYIFSQKALKMYLCFRIFRTELCKKSFREIPNYSCHAGDDSLIFFIIAYYADSFIGVPTECKYNYYLGRGISTRQNMPLDKFRKYCEMNRIPGILDAFIHREGDKDTAYNALHNLTVKMISNCCFYYTMIGDEDKEEAQKILFEHWKNFSEFSEGIFDHCNTIFDSKNREIKKINKKHSSAIKELTKEHKEKITELKEKQTIKITELKEKQTNMIAELKEKQKTRIAELKAEIKNKNEVIKSIQKENKETARALNAKIREKDKLIKHREAEIEMIYNSASYKVGNLLIRPLHIIKQLLGKAR